MNELQVCSMMLQVLALSVMSMGMHNIDNSWNIKGFANHNEIIDCSSFLCADENFLYKIGVGMLLFSSILILLSLVCQFLNAIQKKVV